MYLTDTYRDWVDGLLSTSEALERVLAHPTATHGYKLDAVARITMRLKELEEVAAKEADHTFGNPLIL